MSLQSGDTYVTGKQLRDRFGGRSDMWLWRLLNDPEADFPKPVVIRRHRYWALSEVQRWIEANRETPRGEAA